MPDRKTPKWLDYAIVLVPVTGAYLWATAYLWSNALRAFGL